MSPVLLQAIGYACGISLGILVLAALINFILHRLEQQPAAKPTDAQSVPEGTPEGSQSA
ncbi:MAG: hypothetical protein Q6L60_00415 [Thermostichus sp. HHBFW_bins_43]